MKNHILFAYNLEDTGKSSKIDATHITEELKNSGLTWVHLDRNHADTRGWLEKEIAYLDPLITDALLADETRPRITHIHDGILLNLRGVNLNQGATPSDMISIRLWVDKTRIISVQRRQLKAIQDIQTLVINQHAPKDSGDFVSLLITKLLHYIAPEIGNLEENIDTIEEQIIAKPEKHLREKIMNIRYEAIGYRRYLFPQRDIIHQLENSTLEWIHKSHKRKLQENYDIITRYIEDLESLRERSQIIKDELSNALSDTLNRNLYVLSVVSAIFLPLHFFAGLLGVNLGGIPYAENKLAFVTFCGLLALLITIQIFLFKKYKVF
jgi:zinc transporter